MARKGKIGRPSAYTTVMADIICQRISDGESLRAICADETMPSTSMVCRWLVSRQPFREQYARAREAQADALFDEMLHISNTPVVGEKTKTDSEGKIEVTTGDMIDHRRLQIETRKWMAARLRPKKYGDKLEIAGDADNPLVTIIENVIVRPKG